MIQPFFGTIDPPPYMKHGPNVQDIEYWYRTVKGARNVFVSILDDQTMNAAAANIIAAATSLHGHDYSEKPADHLNNMLSHFPRWRAEVRKFYLRHAVYSMTQQQQNIHNYYAGFHDTTAQLRRIHVCARRQLLFGAAGLASGLL